MAVSSIAVGPVQTADARLEAPRPPLRARLDAWLAAERDHLPLWIPVCFGLGVASWFALPWREQWPAAAAVFAGVALLGLGLRGLAGRCLVAAGVIALAGLAVASLRGEGMNTERLAREIVAFPLTGAVIAIDRQPARDRVRIVLAPDNRALPDRVRISVRGDVPLIVAPGAKIAVRATLRPPPGPSAPGSYDFARRAWFEGIGATGFALGAVSVTAGPPPPSGASAWLADLRARLTARMQEAVGGSAGGVAAALITGDTGGIDEATTAAWRDSGIAHLLSISGLHIAVVVAGVMGLVRGLLCLSPWIALRWPVKTIAAAAAAVAGIVYTLLAGGEVPTVRTCLATIVVLIGLVLGRQAISLRTVAVAAMLILLLRPEALMGPSFQLSFAAVIAIVSLYESPLGRRLAGPGDDAPGLVRRLLRGAIALLVSGLAVELVLAPIALAHFGRQGVYGVAANLFAIPFSSFVVMPALFAAVLLDAMGLGAPAFAMLRWSIGLLNELAAAAAGWPGAVMRASEWPTAAFALTIAGGLWVLLWRSRRRWWGLPFVIAGFATAAASPPADILVSPDGRHLGVRHPDGSLALLRPMAGAFIVDMWSDSVAAGRAVAIEDDADADCTPDLCMIRIVREGRVWTIVSTRSRRWIDRPRFEPLCRRADIVVSDRRLPRWCTPRWLKLDAPALQRLGAVAIRLSPPSVDSVSRRSGDHPWARYDNGDAPAPPSRLRP
ncbi:MAG: ComEC/Rec2 family competence protein [Alphaproteobacteria bacterium]|nr:ComEC/Rec2 family competence protein [Alphaproteobacteria bacterium]